MRIADQCLSIAQCFQRRLVRCANCRKAQNEADQRRERIASRTAQPKARPTFRAAVRQRLPRRSRSRHLHSTPPVCTLSNVTAPAPFRACARVCPMCCVEARCSCGELAIPACVVRQSTEGGPWMADDKTNTAADRRLVSARRSTRSTTLRGSTASLLRMHAASLNSTATTATLPTKRPAA